jgi:hypothetical protein
LFHSTEEQVLEYKAAGWVFFPVKLTETVRGTNGHFSMNTPKQSLLPGIWSQDVVVFTGTILLCTEFILWTRLAL